MCLEVPSTSTAFRLAGDVFGCLEFSVAALCSLLYGVPYHQRIYGITRPSHGLQDEAVRGALRGEPGDLGMRGPSGLSFRYNMI